MPVPPRCAGRALFPSTAPDTSTLSCRSTGSEWGPGICSKRSPVVWKELLPMPRGTDLARTIRTRLGNRLIRHDEWDSHFPYSTAPSSWSPRPDKIATHHHGASARLPRQSGTRAGAAAQIKYVDNIHTSPPRNWAHGFAYGFAILKGGFIGEGRSFWYP